MSLREFFMGIVDRVALEAIRVRPFLPTYTHLLTSTVFLLYTGAHASLTRPASAAELEKKPKKSDDDSGEEDDDEDEIVVQKMEGMSPSDAFIFPVMAGVTLASLYFLIKWLKDPAVLNQILNYYFSFSGGLFVIKFLKDTFSTGRSLVFPSQYSENGVHWRISTDKRQFRATALQEPEKVSPTRTSPLPGIFNKLPLSKQLTAVLWSIRSTLYAKATLKFHLHRIISLRSPVDILDATAVVIALPVVAYFAFISKPWYLTNFLGCSFSYGSLQFMSPTTFSTGSLLLGALFLYDIYFVFFTPMMVTVATKLDVPIKLLFPRPPGPDADPTKQALSMLGLGDIIIPGMMIGLALRFDLYLHYLRKQVTKKNDADGETTIAKAKYRQATGSWGERFWTAKSLQPDAVQAKTFPKPYFKAGLVGYVAGMAVTLLAMQISDHPQPALLYLVPGVLGSLAGTALIKGDLREMYKFSEDSGDDSKKKKAEEKTNDAKGKQTDNTEDTQEAAIADDRIKSTQSTSKTNDDTPADVDDKSPSSSSEDSWDGLDSEPSSRSSQSKSESHEQDEEERTHAPSSPTFSSSGASTTTTEKSTSKSPSSRSTSNSNSASKSRPLFHLSITLPPSPPGLSEHTAQVDTDNKPNANVDVDTNSNINAKTATGGAKAKNQRQS